MILRCTDPHFQSKNENFQLKLHVKNANVDVVLNNINLGSITTQGPNTARGGIFGSMEGKNGNTLGYDRFECDIIG